MPCRRRFACAVALVAVAGLALPAAAADPDLLLWLKLDETTGTVAADASGNGHTATVVTGSGTPEWVAGRRGNALEIAGLTATRARYVQVPWATSLAVTNGLTVMSWIRLNVAGGGHGGGEPEGASSDQTIVGRSTSTDWHFLARQSEQRLVFILEVGSTRVTLTGNVPGAGLTSGVWYHAAATYDGSRMRIYLNGVELANRTCSGNVKISSSAGIPLGVGALPSSATVWQDGFPGALDEVKIWKRALTASEILAEMSAGSHLSRLQWRENF
ncbi:MAG: LamG domain-containing protein [Candidatus Krumholzibacteriia bacterium]